MGLVHLDPHPLYITGGVVHVHAAADLTSSRYSHIHLAPYHLSVCFNINKNGSENSRVCREFRTHLTLETNSTRRTAEALPSMIGLYLYR